MTRQEIIEHARTIDGYMADTELDVIYELANKYIKNGGLMAEVGVLNGRSSYIWGSVCKERNATLICVDVDLLTAKKNLAGLPILFYEGFSHDLAGEIKNNSLDICFIDADHRTEAVLDDISLYLPKMKIRK